MQQTTTDKNNKSNKNIQKQKSNEIAFSLHAGLDWASNLDLNNASYIH